MLLYGKTLKVLVTAERVMLIEDLEAHSRRLMYLRISCIILKGVFKGKAYITYNFTMRSVATTFQRPSSVRIRLWTRVWAQIWRVGRLMGLYSVCAVWLV